MLHHIRRLLALFVIAAVLVPGTGTPALAQVAPVLTPIGGAAALATSVRVGMDAPPLPLLAAQHLGFFAGLQLAVTFVPLPSAEQQLAALRAGQVDLLATPFDSVASARLNASAPLDLQAFFALDGGMDFTLSAAAPITSAAALRGTTIAVESASASDAVVLAALLRRAGLAPSAYQLVALGSSSARLAALQSGSVAAAMLHRREAQLASAAGLRTLGTVANAVQPYLGTVLAAPAGWIEAHAATATRLATAIGQAAQLIGDPAANETVVELVQFATPAPRALAVQIVAAERDAAIGIVPDGSLDGRAVANVLALRRAAGGFTPPRSSDELASVASGLMQRSIGSAARRAPPVTRAATTRVLVMTYLQPGVTAERYEQWLVTRSYPFSSDLASIINFQAYRLDPTGVGEEADYVELVDVTDYDFYQFQFGTHPSAAILLGEFSQYIALLRISRTIPISPLSAPAR